MGDTKKPDGEHIDVNAIREALNAAEESVEIVIERTKENRISVTVTHDTPDFDIGEDDLEELSSAELRIKLSQAEAALAELEDTEPDEDDEDAYEEWEDKRGLIEDLIGEIEDRISDLEDTED